MLILTNLILKIVIAYAWLNKRFVLFHERYSNSSQDTAKSGSFHLVPSRDTLDDLRKDYANMVVMILGEYPSFDKIIAAIKDLESQLNNT